MPKTRMEFWVDKLQKNVERDQRNMEALQDDGWQALILWECEIKTDLESVAAKIQRFLA